MKVFIFALFLLSVINFSSGQSIFDFFNLFNFLPFAYGGQNIQQTIQPRNDSPYGFGGNYYMNNGYRQNQPYQSNRYPSNNYQNNRYPSNNYRNYQRQPFLNPNAFSVFGTGNTDINSISISDSSIRDTAISQKLVSNFYCTFQILIIYFSALEGNNFEKILWITQMNLNFRIKGSVFKIINLCNGINLKLFATIHLFFC